LSRSTRRCLLVSLPTLFVTCFYCILDPKSATLSYANAGHDLPYLRSQGGDCEELRARGMPLGLMPGMSYEEKEAVLGGLGAGGRHHPPYAPTLRIPKLNFREFGFF
jgi:hypothetical protein